MRLAAVAACLSLAASPAASDIVLQLPVDCTIGDSCYIQHLPDRDPSSGVQDYQCGGLSYDGHKGTDFALPTLAAMQAGVAVLAAAPGVVAGMRDGMPDRYYTADTDIDGRECGNGVVIRHDDGWETQYCHMREGSVTVRTGDSVAAGQKLGDIGLSGQTQFPHLHLSLRKDGQQADPFRQAPGCAPAPADDTLWADPPEVSPGGLIYAGFAPGIPDYDAIKQGTAAVSTLPDTAPGLVLFGFAYGAQADDVLRLDITGPDGPFLTQDITLPKTQAQLFRATGRKRTTPTWPHGTYSGTVTLLRNGTPLDSKTVTTQVR
ncbi:MAG: peptidase M24 [Rhodobacteraceae bacterium]|nr:peptidase M24 [Paracoccaceae bacterium]